MGKGGCHINKELVLIPSPEVPFELKAFSLQTPSHPKSLRGYFRLHLTCSPPVEMGHVNQPGTWRGPHGPQRSRLSWFWPGASQLGEKKTILKMSRCHWFTCYFPQKDGGGWQVSQQTAMWGSDRRKVETAEL